MSEQTSTVETIEADSQDALVSVTDMEVYFPVTAGLLVQRKVADVKAVDGVSFSVKKGETLGLVVNLVVVKAQPEKQFSSSIDLPQEA